MRIRFFDSSARIGQYVSLAGLKPAIPPEQLERIQPLVDQLLAQIHREVLTLPPDADSALVYKPEPEEPA
ncbi:MAG TPA: hypothetical protein VMB25_21275 [Bryobacteraceae bacterium]|nr:hypothetical protein [Bryobacteraceae bacterium]